MSKETPLRDMLNNEGIKSVRELAGFIEVRPETLNNWYKLGKLDKLDGAIKRYKEAKR